LFFTVCGSNFEKSISQNELTYLIPDFQNPTGFSYSPTHRQKIASIIEKNAAILIEDSPYLELYFDEAYQSISQALPKQSYHLGSFSKVLAPALRIGWIRADTSLLTPLIAYKEAMDLHTSSITQAIVYEYLKNTKQFDKHLSILRTVYKEKMLYFAKALDEILPNFKYKHPKGGMFIYGRLDGVDSTQLVQKCLKKGVVFVPASEFGGNADEIRFNFTHSSFSQIRIGLARIKQCCNLILLTYDIVRPRKIQLYHSATFFLGFFSLTSGSINSPLIIPASYKNCEGL
jgi:2-aminoadipate transaminase